VRPGARAGGEACRDRVEGMQAWPAPTVPRLTGDGPSLHLHDTSTGALAETTPGATARMYVCGITPYDAAHLGHAATYLAFDLLQRSWRDAGHVVHYVQNVTDVDDPLLERATATGEDWEALAEREIAVFRTDMTALRILPPDQYVGAVAAIPLVIDLVSQLRDLGATYEVDGDIYFSVTADPSFGSVSGLSRDEMLGLFAERGGDPDRPGKKDPLDCLLWLAARPGEPSWPSPFGDGRPGWHIECVAIALANLGMSFDVQGGGSDLVFPHHEMGASEAQVLIKNKPYARTYVHAGMVALDGEKMSKSKGNLVFVHRLRAAGHDPMAIRLALLAHHYRDDWEWTADDLTSAEQRLARWRSAVAVGSPGATSSGAESAPVVTAVRAAMANDLDAPAALASIDAWAAAALDESVGANESEATEIRDLVDALLGVAL
jgi:L-cysteine:1D-myo-inositol 2-amino-2-deoxy-alpha-D-glucopyranoside ligase